MTIIKSMLSASMLVSKSVEFDIKLMRVRALPLRWRLRFVVRKYRTLLRLRAGRPSEVRNRAAFSADTGYQRTRDAAVQYN